MDSLPRKPPNVQNNTCNDDDKPSCLEDDRACTLMQEVYRLQHLQPSSSPQNNYSICNPKIIQYDSGWYDNAKWKVRIETR